MSYCPSLFEWRLCMATSPRHKQRQREQARSCVLPSPARHLLGAASSESSVLASPSCSLIASQLWERTASQKFKEQPHESLCNALASFVFVCLEGAQRFEAAEAAATTIRRSPMGWHTLVIGQFRHFLPSAPTAAAFPVRTTSVQLTLAGGLASVTCARCRCRRRRRRRQEWRRHFSIWSVLYEARPVASLRRVLLRFQGRQLTRVAAIDSLKRQPLVGVVARLFNRCARN